MRRLAFLFHRYLGLVLAALLLVAAATGSVLVFRAELDAWLNPDLFVVPSRPALPAPTLVRMLQQAHPDWTVRGFGLHVRPGHALQLGLVPPQGAMGFEEQVFLDPANGRIVGRRTIAPGINRAHLLQTVFILHYTLLAGTPGRWLMGLAAAGWLSLNLLGVWITWPRRRPYLRNWRSAWITTAGALRRRPMPELHRVGGLWLLAPLTVLAATSVALNFFDELVQPLVEAVSPPRPSPFDQPARPGQGPVIGFAAAERVAVAAAATDAPGLAPVAITDDPLHGVYVVDFARNGTPFYEGFGRIGFAVDRHAARLVFVDRPRLDGAGRLFLRALYPVHSGQVGGLATRLLVLALGLATCALTATGFLPWWRRWRSRRGAS